MCGHVYGKRWKVRCRMLERWYGGGRVIGVRSIMARGGEWMER